MRDQGRLVEWFDEKGYGFIQPNDSQKDRVFLHIKDFARPGPRPIIGCALEYVPFADGKGRFRAYQVRYVSHKSANEGYKHRNTDRRKKSVHLSVHKNGHKKSPFLKYLSLSYLPLLAICTLLGYLDIGILVLVLMVNCLTFILYFIDKVKAVQQKWRIQEKTLHILAVLGGWPTAFLAQEKFRHKTQKQTFRDTYFITIVVNILIMACLILPIQSFIL